MAPIEIVRLWYVVVCRKVIHFWDFFDLRLTLRQKNAFEHLLLDTGGEKQLCFYNFNFLTRLMVRYKTSSLESEAKQ